MATRTLTLRVPEPLANALTECALGEERDFRVQTERLIREGLQQLGYWPPADLNRARSNETIALRGPGAGE